jgi:hypothetical protein
MMPHSKSINLLVQHFLLRLPEKPEFYSRYLFNKIVSNEGSAATHEFFATELVERGEAERWSRSQDEALMTLGLRRLNELDEAAEYESIRDVPRENWQLYRYVVARQLGEAFKEAKVNLSMFSESARIRTRASILARAKIDSHSTWILRGSKEGRQVHHAEFRRFAGFERVSCSGASKWTANNYLLILGNWRNT